MKKSFISLAPGVHRFLLDIPDTTEELKMVGFCFCYFLGKKLKFFDVD
jgi:hypothetical protein